MIQELKRYFKELPSEDFDAYIKSCILFYRKHAVIAQIEIIHLLQQERLAWAKIEILKYITNYNLITPTKEEREKLVNDFLSALHNYPSWIEGVEA